MPVWPKKIAFFFEIASADTFFGGNFRKVIIVGSGKKVSQLAEFFTNNQDYGYKLEAVFEFKSEKEVEFDDHLATQAPAGIRMLINNCSVNLGSIFCIGWLQTCPLQMKTSSTWGSCSLLSKLGGSINIDIFGLAYFCTNINCDCSHLVKSLCVKTKEFWFGAKTAIFKKVFERTFVPMFR